MKKITTILMLLMLTCMGAWAEGYSGIQLTFNKNGTGDSPTQNVTVAVADLNGNALDGVTASVVETNFTAFQTSGSINAINNSTGFAFTPKANTGYNNQVGGTISYTFKIEGLATDLALNTAVLRYYGINAAGAGQGSNNSAEFSIDMQTGADQSSLSSFASLAASTFFKGVTTSDLGTLYTERTLKSSSSVTSANALYVQVTLTKTAGDGCFPGLGKLEISGTTPEQEAAFEKVQSWLPFMQESLALVTDASNYISNARQQDWEGNYASLLDKDNGTYFHSAWSGTMSGQPNHDLQARLPEAVDVFYLFYVTRGDNNGNGYPQAMRIDGSNNAADFTDAAAGGATWTNSVSSLSGLPSGKTSYYSDKITLSEAYQYLRFVPDVSYKNTNWFCLAEFWLFPSNAAIDAAITMMKSVNSVYDITAEKIAEINQIDEDLRNTTAEVTYVVKDANGNPLFTSEPQTVAKGTTITTLPADFQRPLFYTYNTVSVTVDGNETIEFTATLKQEPLFQFTKDTTNPVWYYLNLKGGAGFPTYVENGDPNVTLPGTNAENDKTSWAFIGNPYGFQIINKAAGSSLMLGSESAKNDGNTGGNTYATLDAAGVKPYQTWSIEDGSNNYPNGFIIRNGEGVALNHRSANNLAFWTGGEGTGSTFVAAKVPERQIPYIQALDEMENGKVYAIYNVRGIWKFAENATSMGTEGVPSDLEALCATPADAYQIGLVKQNDKFYIYNVAQGKYLAAGNKLYQSPLEAVTIEASTSSAAVGNYKWFFSFDSNHNINVSSGKVLIDTWNTHDQGNVNAIMVTDATYTVNDALAAFTDYTQCITDYCAYKEITTDFVQNLGQFGYPKAATEATTAFLAILDRNASGANTAEDWNTFMDKYNAVFAAENMKMPEPGNFYRIKGYSGNYITLNTAANNASMSGEANINNIVCYTPDKQLVFYANGLGMYNTSIVAPLGTTLNTYTFLGGAQKGHFYIKSNASGVGTYCFDNTANGSKVDRNGSPVTSGSYQTDWTIEEVTELPITLKKVGDKYYGTFYSPVAISDIAGDCVVYKVAVEGNVAKATKLDVSGVPAGKGVLIIGDGGTDATMTVTATIGEYTGTDTETGLKGVTATEKVKATDGDKYTNRLFLGTKNGNIGFYKVNTKNNTEGEGENMTTYGKTGAFKAYLEYLVQPQEGGANDAKEFMLVFDGGVTGIENMEHGAFGNGAVYNLQGQRVTKATKGVFIQNGKKVVLK